MPEGVPGHVGASLSGGDGKVSGSRYASSGTSSGATLRSTSVAMPATRGPLLPLICHTAHAAHCGGMLGSRSVYSRPVVGSIR